MDDFVRALFASAGLPSAPGGLRTASSQFGSPGALPPNLLDASLGTDYLHGWSAREQAWGLQGLAERLAAMQGGFIPGTSSGPFDPGTPVPTTEGEETTAPEQNWQGLADEMGVSPKKAQRKAARKAKPSTTEAA